MNQALQDLIEHRRTTNVFEPNHTISDDRLNIWSISRHEPRLHSTFRTGDSWQCEISVLLVAIRRAATDNWPQKSRRPLTEVSFA